MYSLPRGHKRLLELLNKITSGTGTMEDIDKMEELCYYIKDNALCGLGQTAPNPVLSTCATSVTNMKPMSKSTAARRRLQGPAPLRDRGRQVPRLHRLRQSMPGGCDFRYSEAASRH